MTVALPGGPLAPDNSIDAQFVMGVEGQGSFRFIVNVETLTTPAPQGA